MNKHPLDHEKLSPSDPSSINAQHGRRVTYPKQAFPPYRVVLLHNEGKSLLFVMHTVMELTHFCRTEATYKMWQAHYQGRAHLLQTHKERAELYVELFAQRGLETIIEQA